MNDSPKTLEKTARKTESLIKTQLIINLCALNIFFIFFIICNNIYSQVSREKKNPVIDFQVGKLSLPYN